MTKYNDYTDPQLNSLLEAIDNNDVSKAKGLIEQIPAETLIQQDSDGRTILHWAVTNGQVEIIPDLLAKNPNLAEQIDQYGYTPLEYSIIQDKADASRAMIEIMTPEQLAEKNAAHSTVLHFAALHNRTELIPDLLAKNPELDNEKDSRGRTAQYYLDKHAAAATSKSIDSAKQTSASGDRSLDDLLSPSRTTDSEFLDALLGGQGKQKPSIEVSLDHLLRNTTDEEFVKLLSGKEERQHPIHNMGVQISGPLSPEWPYNDKRGALSDNKRALYDINESGNLSSPTTPGTSKREGNIPNI